MQVGTSLTCDVSGPESLFQTQVERPVEPLFYTQVL